MTCGPRMVPTREFNAEAKRPPWPPTCTNRARRVRAANQTPMRFIVTIAILGLMRDHGELLGQVMSETATTQSELARLSGVHQPSISQFLSGKVDLSDDQLDRLVSCMGYRLEVVRRTVVPELTRSEWRSWKLHRQLSRRLTRSTLAKWRPTIAANLNRLNLGVRGHPK